MAKPHETKDKSTLGLYGAALLAGAALITKLIGVLQKIPLQNLAGDRVFGIYNAVYPLYQIIIVFATAGLPTAISIIIAQQLQAGASRQHIRGILHTALITMGGIGIVAAIVMWALADPLAAFMGDHAASRAISSLALAMAIVPLTAVLRGYMQALELTSISALSQVMEQLIRVGVMIMVLLWSLSAAVDAGRLTELVMYGSAAGALAAFILLVSSTSRGDRLLPEGSGGLGIRAAINAAKRLLVIAAPAVLGAAVVPAMGVVDAFTIPRMLISSGHDAEAAMGQFGIYSRAMPLVQLVIMIAGAACSALVPRLVLITARVKLWRSVWILMRLFSLFGLAASIGLILLAEPINVMLYKNQLGTDVFAIIGGTVLASSILSVLTPLLQVTGATMWPMYLLFIAVGAKAWLNVILTKQFGIIGAAFAGLTALSVAAIIGIWMIYYKTKLKGKTKESSRSSRTSLMAAIAALVLMIAAVIMVQWALSIIMSGVISPRIAAVIYSITGVLAGGSIFIFVLLKASFIQREEGKLLGLSEKWLNKITH